MISMKKTLSQRGVSGSMELSYIWEEEQSGYQTEYTTTVTLRATTENCVTLREEVQVDNTSCPGHGYEYDVDVDELIGWIKEHGTKRII